MFDVGFSQLLVIAVVALLVVGPERMPRVARTAGALLGRARRQIHQLRADVEGEVDFSEINRIRSTLHDAAHSIEQSIGQAREELNTAAGVLSESEILTPEVQAALAAARREGAPAQPKIEQPIEQARAEPDSAAGSLSEGDILAPEVQAALAVARKEDASAQLDLFMNAQASAAPSNAPGA